MGISSQFGLDRSEAGLTKQVVRRSASKKLVWRGTAAELSVSDDPENGRNAGKAIDSTAKQSKRLRDK